MFMLVLNFWTQASTLGSTVDRTPNIQNHGLSIVDFKLLSIFIFAYKHDDILVGIIL